MEKYKIHYAAKKIHGNIPCLEFKTIEDIRSFIFNLTVPLTDDTVYLVSINEEILITENIAFLIEIFDGKLNSIYPFFEGEEIFIQEYNSYESAYKSALEMKEQNKLCYE
jgi:hypothetical protein